MLNVFFPLRIAFKADLIMNNLEQTYNIDFGKRGPSDVSHGELKFVCQVDFLSFFLTIGASTANLMIQLKERLSCVVGLANRLSIFTELCTVEEFLNLGLVNDDLAAIEKKIDIFVEVTCVALSH